MTPTRLDDIRHVGNDALDRREGIKGLEIGPYFARDFCTS
jgi:hypothetical protein